MTTLIRKCLLAISLFVFAVSAALAGASQERLKIVLRYDDYSDYTSMAVAESIIEQAKKLGAGVLVGVIPFPYAAYPKDGEAAAESRLILSQEKIGLLKKYLSEGAIEVAVHGFSHRNNVPKGRHSEFTGLPETLQRTLLGTAKRSLERALGGEVRAFVPPFNQYDAATLRALEATGYRLLSAGMNSYSNSVSGLAFLPGTIYIQQLKETVDAALRNGHTDAAVVVTIHPYDIAESGEEFPEFRRKHGQKQVSLRSVIEELERIGGLARVELSSVTRMVDGGEDLSMERAQANLRLRESVVTRYHLLPAVLGLYPQYGLYYSMDAAERLYSRQKYAAVVLYGALVLLAGLVTGAVLRKISYRWGKAALVTGLASLIGIAGIGTIFAVSGFHAIFVYAVACCLGGLAGALVSGRSP